MASIVRRGESWRALVRRQGYPSQSGTFNTRAEADRWARSVEAQMDAGRFVSVAEAERTTLEEVLDRYERDVLPTKRSIKGTRPHIRVLRDTLGKYTLAALSSAIVSRYRDERLRSVGPQTVKHDLSVLSRVLNTCMREWGIALPRGNVVQQVRLPRLPSGRERRLEPGECGALLGTLPSPHDDLLCFAIETAMRRSELVAMRWEHIDKTGRILAVPEGKTAARRVPLSPVAREILAGLNKRDAMVWGLQPDSITQAFERACARAGIVGLTFHDLRHEGTSRLFERGFSAEQVRTVTGHKTLAMLARYTHLRAEDLADLMDAAKSV